MINKKYLNFFKESKMELILSFFSLLALIGALIYKFYALNTIGTVITLFLTVFTFIIILFLFAKSNFFKYKEYTLNISEKKAGSKENIAFIALYLALFLSSIFILYSNATDHAINSPWSAVPSYFFIFYFLATLVLIASILQKIKFTTTLLALHYFLTFSIALIIYKIGYGFDPFVHQATMEAIIEKGSVSPKPFYYLGQYSVLIILHKITFIPLIVLHKFIVPVFSIILPFVFLKLLNQWFDDRKKNNLTVLGLLIIPYSLFIVTTPQNLAYLFLILTIIYGLLCSRLNELLFCFLLALACLTIHPLAGIPALLFVILITIYHSETKKILKYPIYFFIFLFSSFSLPAIFYFLENKNINIQFLQNINISFDKLRAFFIFHNPGAENFILNFVHFYQENLGLIITALIILGLTITGLNFTRCKILFLNILMSISLFISYILTQNLRFDYLINYEREIFANRLLTLSIIFLLPFLLIAIYWIIERILKQRPKIKVIIILMAIIFITASLYNIYPRSDRYANSHSYATGQSDLDAVQWIEENTDKDYVVLANQQVSAAALQTFGFSKYYKNDIYFYPVPTGEELYQYYLDMVYKTPSQETALKAMDLADVDEVYFVLNKYWWAFPKILAEAKLSADSWTEHGDGEIFIFKYIR